jgi:hypothetical protein
LAASVVNFVCFASYLFDFEDIKLVTNTIDCFVMGLVEDFAVIKARFTKAEDLAITRLTFSNFKVVTTTSQVVAILDFEP